MVLILEVSRPWCSTPFYFRSRIMTRIGWGFWAIAWLHVPLKELAETALEWRYD